MLEAPGGGGGGTPWEAMTVDDMQRLIQNPDTDKQWELVSGWKKSAELISEHQWQVQDYRDNLAAAWPPDRSAASREYLTRLDALIANLKETYEAALANHDAVSAATGSIYQAQIEMDKIYQEYQSNKTALDQYNAKQQPQDSTTPTPTPSPSGEQPPVAPGRQEALRVKAATMLSSVSSELAQAQIKIVKPAEYKPPTAFDDTKPVQENPYIPPPIPPITPSFADTSSSTSSTRPSAAFATNPSVGAPITPQSGITQPGLVLGGATAPPLPPPTTGINPIAPTLPGGTGPLANPGVPPPSTFLPGGGPSALPPTTGVGRGPGGLPREGVVRPGTSPEGTRAMPAGGIIGQAPGAGLGQPAAGRAGGRRINPVGGVIGEGERSLGSRRGPGIGGMSAAERTGGMYGQGAGHRSGRRNEADSTHWDPDNPWETAEGVDPVVLPVQEQRIDPGPAIGLI